MPILEAFPYLRIRNAPAAIEFYKAAFGATEKFRIAEPSGRVGHAELALGPMTLMLSEEYPEFGILGPQSVGGTTSAIHLHVDDADAFIARAVAAGATVVRPASDQPHGERSGTVRDPFGHEWYIGHEFEAMSPEEMQRRYTALLKDGG
jgi:uncharacterized glyoxalase superfamily protein PhnB